MKKESRKSANFLLVIEVAMVSFSMVMAAWAYKTDKSWFYVLGYAAFVVFWFILIERNMKWRSYLDRIDEIKAEIEWLKKEGRFP